MKKNYETPALFAESFLLTEHIAACDILGKPNSPSPDSCTYSFESTGGIIELFTVPSSCLISSEMVEDYIGAGQLLIGS